MTTTLAATGATIALLTLLLCAWRSGHRPPASWVSNCGTGGTRWWFTIGMGATALLTSPLLLELAAAGFGTRLPGAAVTCGLLLLASWHMNGPRQRHAHVAGAILFFVSLFAVSLPSLRADCAVIRWATAALAVPYAVFIVAALTGQVRCYGPLRAFAWPNTVDYLTSMDPQLGFVRTMEWITVVAMLGWLLTVAVRLA
ncbi:MAG: hypothetical protein KDC98_08000 [Planctomycetes bacterium]|nr:hypothetical protein [Planctomycetota bacterium]